jgi:hypothetical protein
LRCCSSTSAKEIKKITSKLIALNAVVLAGCGGGGSGDGGTVQTAPQFIVWAGSSAGIHVVDGPGHVLAFYSDTGCLYNFQTGQENSAFCLFPRSNVVAYGAFRGQVTNVLASDGTCEAAIIDSMTDNFSDIELDAFGREVVLTTQLHPALCGP